MGNFPRYVPDRSLVEVTTRTIHGRLLLRPSRDLNSIVRGVLGRAAARYDVAIVAFATLSNHWHLLLVPRDAEQLAAFMAYVNGNLAKEVGRLHQWKEKVWSRRYRAIVVSDEPEAQVARLRYILQQGCKEGLVRSPRQWPGATSTDSLLTGKPITGWWFDRSAEFEARRRGETPGKFAHAEEVSFELESLPCWRERSPEQRRRAIADLVLEIEAETRASLARRDQSPVGRKKILQQHPHEAPGLCQRSPAPRFHCATASMRKSLELAFFEFRAWYRQAAADLRTGMPEVEFPPGCFPPRLPFCCARAAPA